MAHNLAKMQDGRYAFARVEGSAEAWHKHGQTFAANASLEEIGNAAGMNFKVLRSKVRYAVSRDPAAALLEFPERHVLFRSDTQTPIAVVSDEYQIVQPMDALEFFRDLCADQRFTMETAGVLAGGAIYWAMARTGNDVNVGRASDDLIQQYVLLSTSADGSRATDASDNSTRVVCENTLRMSDSTAGRRVKVRHSSVFDANAVKAKLSLLDLDASWERFRQQMLQLQGTPVTDAEANAFFSQLLRPNAKQSRNATSFAELLTGTATLEEPAEKTRAIRGLADLELSYVAAPGACPGTAYGVLQGVTHFVDHVRGNDAKRQQSAWFGQGDTLKSTAFEQLLTMA